MFDKQLRIFLVSLALIGCALNTLAQAGGYPKIYSKTVLMSDDDKQFFLSITPFVNSNYFSATFLKNEPSTKLAKVWSGSKRCLYLGNHEFDCLERIFRYSFIISQNMRDSETQNNIPIEIGVHTTVPYIDALLVTNGQISVFFNTLIEEVQCKKECFSDENYKIILNLIYDESKYLRRPK